MVSRSFGDLLAAVAAVEVAADGDVPGVAGKLADVVDVIDDLDQRHPGIDATAVAPAQVEHHHIAHRAHDAACAR